MPNILTLTLLLFTYTNHNVTIEWSGPFTNTDGSAITAPLTYNLYRTLNGGAQKQMRVGIAETEVTFSEAIKSGDSYCYFISAIENSVESNQLQLACVEEK